MAQTQAHTRSKALHDYAAQYLKDNGWYFVDLGTWMSTDDDEVPATVFVTLCMVNDTGYLGIMFGFGDVESGHYVYLCDMKSVRAMLDNAIHLQKMARGAIDCAIESVSILRPFC